MPPTNYKRLIVCCDGTWVDGLASKTPNGYTNVLRIARAILPSSIPTETSPSVPQVVFYGSRVGSAPDSIFSKAQGLTGAGLAVKVEEAHSFITSNWIPGDEIFLFGFSRGAYTVRQVAALLNSIGVLSPTDMEQFPDLFLALQKEGKKESEILQRGAPKLKLKRKREKGSCWLLSGRRRRAIGVFETVGSLGLPIELTREKTNKNTLLGFTDTNLGTTIQFAFQALALNETRNDFVPTKWIMTPEGRDKGQTLTQVWFIGAHSDVGGGETQHDLSDLSLAWMVSNIERFLSININYVTTIPDPVAPWGMLKTHNDATGLFSIASLSQRPPPTAPASFPTFESVQTSVIYNPSLPASLSRSLQEEAVTVYSLAPFEQFVKDSWPFNPTETTSAATGMKKRQNPISLGAKLDQMGLGGKQAEEVATAKKNENEAATIQTSGHSHHHQDHLEKIHDKVEEKVEKLLDKFGIHDKLGSQ